jgi:hypothetical protein
LTDDFDQKVLTNVPERFIINNSLWVEIDQTTESGIQGKSARLISSAMFASDVGSFITKISLLQIKLETGQKGEGGEVGGRGWLQPFGAPEIQRGGKFGRKIKILNKKKINFLLSKRFKLLNCM